MYYVYRFNFGSVLIPVQSFQVKGLPRRSHKCEPYWLESVTTMQLAARSRYVTCVAALRLEPNSKAWLRGHPFDGHYHHDHDAVRGAWVRSICGFERHEWWVDSQFRKKLFYIYIFSLERSWGSTARSSRGVQEEHQGIHGQRLPEQQPGGTYDYNLNVHSSSDHIMDLRWPNKFFTAIPFFTTTLSQGL